MDSPQRTLGGVDDKHGTEPQVPGFRIVPSTLLDTRVSINQAEAGGGAGQGEDWEWESGTG